jgi:hypothetical protein
MLSQQSLVFMKRIPLAFLFLSCTLLSSMPSFAGETASELASEGQRAYAAGDQDTAKLKFREALKLDPGNVAAKNYLKMIVMEEMKNNTGSNRMQLALKKLVVPIEFNNATLSAALDYLKKQAAKASNGAVQPSFVIEPGVNPDTPVSLQLSHVPFTEALRYIGDMIHADFIIEQYAIRVKPKSGVSAGPAIKSDVAATGKVQASLKSLMIPTVEFNDAKLNSALDYLKKQATSASKGELQPSFVIEPGVNPEAPVTLHLSNVPFTEVLRYVGDMVGAEFVVEQYAIRVRPKAAANTGAEPAATSPSPSAP